MEKSDNDFAKEMKKQKMFKLIFNKNQKDSLENN